MCRHVAFPPRFPRAEAINICLEMEKANTDGVGSVYIKDKQFVVNKYPKSLSWAVKKGKPIFHHMPYNDGWTIVHLRAASHGCNCQENTHPFLVGDWAFTHNGIWSDYRIVKLAMGKNVELKGDTDSEVAANLINMIGPKKFTDEVSFGGTFFSLNRSGDLHVMKISGDLELLKLADNRILISSELDWNTYPKAMDALKGWYRFDKDGNYVKHKEKKEKVYFYEGNRSSYNPTSGIWKQNGSVTHGIYRPFSSSFSEPEVNEPELGLSHIGTPKTRTIQHGYYHDYD